MISDRIQDRLITFIDIFNLKTGLVLPEGLKTLAIDILAKLWCWWPDFQSLISQ